MSTFYVWFPQQTSSSVSSSIANFAMTLVMDVTLTNPFNFDFYANTLGFDVTFDDPDGSVLDFGCECSLLSIVSLSLRSNILQYLSLRMVFRLV